jgi:hypothetical protein
MTLVGVLVMTMEGFHSKDSWWAKEGDSYDYGKDFIVRILGGLKTDRGRGRGGGNHAPSSMSPLGGVKKQVGGGGGGGGGGAITLRLLYFIIFST